MNGYYFTDYYDGNDIKIPVKTLEEYGASGIRYDNMASSVSVIIEAKY